MAKARPSLDIAARPVSTFVAPNQNAVAAELYDQQAVQNALQFADAFSNLSVSAARLAGALKQEWNEEEMLKGQDLVNQSRRSYQQLVSEGQIKPTENPWFAIGAQKASGTMEAAKARANFETLLEKKIQEDPNFLDDPRGFDAFAYQYTQNVNQFIGDASYMSRAFYESFNPFVGSMQAKHEQRVIEHNENKILTSISPVVEQSLADLSSLNPTVRETAIATLQTRLDEMGKSGVSTARVNNAVAAQLVDMMKSGDNPERAQQIFNSLKAGTGRLADTQFAKTLVLENQGAIAGNISRTSLAETKAIRQVIEGDLAPKVLAGKMTQEEAEARLDAFLVGPERKVQISSGEYDQSVNQLRSRIAFLQNQQEQTIKEQTLEKRKQLDAGAADAVGLLQQSIMADADGGADTLNPGYQKRQLDQLNSILTKYEVSDADRAKFQNTLRDQLTSEAGRQERVKNSRMERTIGSVYNDVDTAAASNPIFSDADSLDLLLSQTDARLASEGFDAADRSAAAVAVTNRWKASAAARAERQEQRMAEMVSSRLGAAEKSAQESIINQISQGNAPDWSREKYQMDSIARSSGIIEGSNEWNAYERKQYNDAKILIEQVMESQAAELGGLAPVIPQPGDNLRVIVEQNTQRERLRTRQLVMRLDLAMTYNQKDAMGEVVDQLMQTSPSALESDRESYEFADVVRATRALVANGREITAIFPGESPNHKVLHDMLRFAVRQQNTNLNEVAKDAYMIRTYATEMATPTTAEELFANPFGWMTKDEFSKFGPNIQGALTDAGVTNPDATIYGSLEYSRLFRDESNKNPANPQTAASVAQRRVFEENVVVKGSLLPDLREKTGFPRRAGSSEAVYLGALAEEYGEAPGLTFVVLRPGADPIFGVRDADGNSVARKNGQPPRTYNAQDLMNLWASQKAKEAERRPINPPPAPVKRQLRPNPGQMPDLTRDQYPY